MKKITLAILLTAVFSIGSIAFADPTDTGPQGSTSCGATAGGNVSQPKLLDENVACAAGDESCREKAEGEAAEAVE